MINVIAVDNLRTLPISAELGMSLIVYYAFAALTFFIPVALVAAELATTYPSTGGIYVWVREAFGLRIAFITIWLQWVYNIVWYPNILVFIVTTLAYVITPELANNRVYLLGTTVSLFWLMTLLNCFGMKISSLVSTLGAIIGTLVPMIGIALLGFIWILQGQPLAIEYPIHWLPTSQGFASASLFTAVLFGLLGIEMSAMHAEEVKHPQRDYPRALLYSTLIIFSTLVLGSLAIVIVVPHEQLSVVSALIDAYAIFFKAYHMVWMTPIIAILIIIGGLSGVSAWIIGPTKGLLVSARDGTIPARFVQINRHGAPVYLLLTQAVIVTLLCSAFVLIDTIQAAYWFLTVLSAQMGLLVYVFMFAAAIKLRTTFPEQTGAYRIPGGKMSLWGIAGIGLSACVLAIAVSFVPPPQIPIHNTVLFEALLLGGLTIFIALPYGLFRSRQH
jgi:amino acid transporter